MIILKLISVICGLKIFSSIMVLNAILQMIILQNCITIGFSLCVVMHKEKTIKLVAINIDTIELYCSLVIMIFVFMILYNNHVILLIEVVAMIIVFVVRMYLVVIIYSKVLEIHINFKVMLYKNSNSIMTYEVAQLRNREFRITLIQNKDLYISVCM